MENIQSEMLKILYYMNEMECEEISMKTKDQEMTVLLTDCEENDRIGSRQECASSNPTESGAQAGDSIIPALLKILPPETDVQWQDCDLEWHGTKLSEITQEMIGSMPVPAHIKYYEEDSSLVIREV